jgi:hypothetical protein
MPSNNFKQWNPTQANQDTDAAYAAETIVQNGAQAGNICASAMDNKFRYQVTTFIKAFADMMVVKGFTLNDTSLATLTTALANVLTTADAINADWNSSSGLSQILNKPTIPAAQIQSDWNQASNVSLDYIKNKPAVLTAASFTGSLTENGYIVLPNGFILQWGFYNATVNAGQTVSITFPISFPTACLNIGALVNNGNTNVFPPVAFGKSKTKTTANFYLQVLEVPYSTGDGMYWTAIGY